jgi:hypothetical protein
MGRIFVSYSRRDIETADRIAGAMKDAGLDIWIDRESIEAGNTWRVQIVQAIDTCDAFVLMLSPRSAASDNVRKEIDLAQDSRRTIFAIMLEPTQLPAEIRYQLTGLQFIDVQMLGFEKAVSQLISTINGHVAKLKPVEEQKTHQAELVIQGIDLKAFDAEKQEQLLGFLAQLVKTSRSELKIAGLAAGSVHVFVDLSAEDAFELKTLALNRDKRFKKFGITALRLAGDKKFINIALGILTTTATIGVLHTLWLSIPSLSPLFGMATGKILTLLLAGVVIAAVSVSVPTVVAPLVFPSPTPVPTATSTVTQTPVPTITLLPTGTATLFASQPPIIDRIEIRENTSGDHLVVLLDVYFRDPDADTNTVDWEVISNSIGYPFEARDGHPRPSPDQKDGKVVTGRWGCGSRSPYEITVEATLVDRAGNKSNSVRVTFSCR